MHSTLQPSHKAISNIYTNVYVNVSSRTLYPNSYPEINPSFLPNSYPRCNRILCALQFHHSKLNLKEFALIGCETFPTFQKWLLQEAGSIGSGTTDCIICIDFRKSQYKKCRHQPFPNYCRSKSIRRKQEWTWVYKNVYGAVGQMLGQTYFMTFVLQLNENKSLHD